MEPTTDFQGNVMEIVNAAALINPHIGFYKKHFVAIKGNTVFIVDVTTGRIEMSRVFASDGLRTLSKEELEQIAGTFTAHS